MSDSVARAFCVALTCVAVAYAWTLLADDSPAPTTEGTDSAEASDPTGTSDAAEAPPETSALFRVEQVEGRLVVRTAEGRPVATYVFADEQILRPYFMHVHAPDATVLTRHHPPREGMELTDHATMHPGIWLGFGDLSGADFWRNKGRVEHVEFVAPPTEKEGVLSFTVRNRYVSGEKTVCGEVCRHTLRRQGNAYLLTYDSTFSDEKPFVFGDQEEMGLGIRVAAPLRVRAGAGKIVNAEGQTNEKDVWGKPSDYCAYHGEVEGRRLGLVVVPHPENFRKSWFHARDYGFLAANPFGRQSFMAGEASKVTVKPGESLRLRFGVVAFSAPADEAVDPATAAKQYVATDPPKTHQVGTGSEKPTPPESEPPKTGEPTSPQS